MEAQRSRRADDDGAIGAPPTASEDCSTSSVYFYSRE